LVRRNAVSRLLGVLRNAVFVRNQLRLPTHTAPPSPAHSETVQGSQK